MLIRANYHILLYFAGLDFDILYNSRKCLERFQFHILPSDFKHSIQSLGILCNDGFHTMPVTYIYKETAHLSCFCCYFSTA
jgi:hypothetical protein